MKVNVIGGGPAGLYYAILHKKSFPDAEVTVYERNRADDTFGFGIVLSDETLGNLKAADEPTYRDIAASFAYWDDIYVHYKGTTIKSSGHGFSGLKRLSLLEILQRRAAGLGIAVHYQADVAAIDPYLNADLVVAADGINSVIRENWKEHFRPTVELRPNKFVWLGARATLPGFTYGFRENEHGIWNLHAYMFTQGECTVIVETTSEAFERAGLGVQDERATVAYARKLFADEFRGADFQTNRSYWRNFPAVRCERWSHENVVLLGDAAHSAHWSIGSGTKLALEDAIALHHAVTRHRKSTKAALRAYEEERHAEADRIQHSANTSLVFFENVHRFWHMEPVQFNFALMSRAKAVTYENLRLRDASVVAELDRWWAAHVAKAEGVRLPKGFAAPPMFAPFHLRGMRLTNRVVVSPMCQYCAVDGTPTDWHFVHYGARAVGGAGLVFTEMTCVAPDARITPGCAGMYRTEHAAAWKRIVQFVHTHTDAKIALQLGHAGRKGSTQLMWEEMDKPLKHGNWPVMAASPLPYYAGESQTPRAMSRADMDRVREQYVAAARMGIECGFDMLELHMAHGYLHASFLSPVTNRRTDAYGGSLENRLRFPLEVFDACRAVWPAEQPMSVRISATDWIPGGNTGEDAVAIARAFNAHGCDLVDVSTGQTDPASKPVYGRMYQLVFAEQIRNEAGIATMAVGAITTADQVNTIVAAGRADLVALARPHLTDPYFTLHAAAEYGYEGASWPKQYLSGKQQLYLLAERAKEEARRTEALVRAAHPVSSHAA
ncbi:MAG: bifunctional salicylyl-CoA 5-hydroxylase/oxidoreductase [Burkholderiales bacterium]|nr:bifunctional salicylyl-CoA 5-hydroxylase/oxidoreductase [Burkholderiales bacterium]